MHRLPLYSLQQHVFGFLAGTYFCALRAVVLAAALVSYGAVPSTPSTPSEIESQLQEELASSRHESECLSRLQGAAARIIGTIEGGPARGLSIADRAQAHRLRVPRHSAGLALPLRC